MANGTDLFDIISTTRAMRRLKPDPVPDELVRKILEAGVCAATLATASTGAFWSSKTALSRRRCSITKRALDEVVGPAIAPVHHLRASAASSTTASILRSLPD